MFFSRELIPTNLIINGYIYMIVMYFIFPYIVRLLVVKKTVKKIFVAEINCYVYISKAAIVRGGLSLQLPFSKDPLYAVSEKAYSVLSNDERSFLLYHEESHIKNNDQINNMLSFFTVIYITPIILTYISTIENINKYILVYLIFAVITYLSLFVMFFILTQNKELRSDYSAVIKTSGEIGCSALEKLYRSHEIREKTFNILATHPSYKKRLNKISNYQYK